jgi:hypothetical protein
MCADMRPLHIYGVAGLADLLATGTRAAIESMDSGTVESPERSAHKQTSNQGESLRPLARLIVQEANPTDYRLTQLLYFLGLVDWNYSEGLLEKESYFFSLIRHLRSLVQSDQVVVYATQNRFSSYSPCVSYLAQVILRMIFLKVSDFCNSQQLGQFMRWCAQHTTLFEDADVGPTLLRLLFAIVLESDSSALAIAPELCDFLETARLDSLPVEGVRCSVSPIYVSALTAGLLGS